jgi:hypothetical protein
VKHSSFLELLTCNFVLKELIQRALKRGSKKSGSTIGTVLNRMSTKETPPTFFRTNKYTSAFQVTSISPTFYEQILHMQIPKTQRDTDGLTVFLSIWDILGVKDVGEINPRCQFCQHLTSSFFVLKCFAKLFSTYSLALHFFV